MILWELFGTFLMIGAFSFGGGYAMLPVIEAEASRNGWMTIQELTDAIAIAGMSPGPIATNTAIIIGHQTAGVSGAIVSALGMILPSLTIILIIATFFYRASQSKWVESAFYGLRPIITGLILYAAVSFALANDVIGHISWYRLSLILVFVLSFLALWKFRMHPVFVILLSGLVGILLYT